MKNDKLKKILQFVSVYIAILLMVHFFWFRGQQYIYYWDQTFSFNPANSFNVFKYVWHSNVGFGNPDVTGINFLPLFWVYKILTSIFSLSFAQQLVMSFVIFISSVCSYFCFRYFLAPYFKNDARKLHFISLLGALFYIVNPFAFIYIWRLYLNSVLLYAFLPAIVVFLDKYFKEKDLLKNLAVLLLLTLIVIPSFSHPAYLISFWGFLSAYGLYLLISKQVKFKAWIIKVIYFIAPWLLLNLWWLLPQILGVRGTVALSGNDSASALSIVNTTTIHTSFINVIRLLGEWHYYDYHFGSLDYRLMKFFTSYISPLTLLFLIPPIFVVYSLWKKRDKLSIFLLVIVVALAIFIMGQNSPFGGIISAAYEKISLVRAFRNPYEKTGIFFAFSYTLLFLISIPILLQRFPFKKVFTVALLPLIIPAVLFMAGYVIPQGTDRLPAARVSISPDRTALADYLKSNSDTNSKILVLPLQSSPLQYSKDDHSGYIGQEYLTISTYLPVISTQSGVQANDKIYTEIANSIYRGNTDLAGIFNIRYVVIDKTLFDSLTYEKIVDQNKLIGSLETNSNFKKVLENGSAVLFENSSYRPVIYATRAEAVSYTDPTLVANDLSTLANQTLLSCAPKNGQNNFDCMKSNGFAASYNVNYQAGELFTNSNQYSVQKDITVPSQGDYNLSVSGNVGNVQINGQESATGKVNLNNGKNTITFQSSDLKTVFDSNQLKDVLPTVFLDNNENNHLFSEKLSTKNNYKLIAQYSDREMASYIDVPEEENSIYKISFSYRQNPDAPQLTLGLREGIEPINPKKAGQQAITETLLNPSTSWQDYSLTFAPQKSQNHLYVYFDTQGSVEDTQSYLANIKIVQVKLPLITISRAAGSSDNAIIPVNFTQKNPTLYQATVKGNDEDLILNFQSSFDPNWTLKVNGKAVSSDNHIIFNGFGNSWLIKDRGDLNITLEYLPQSKEDLLKKISLVSLIVFMLIAAGYVLKKKR